MKNIIIKKLTLILTIILCTQAPLHAVWGWWSNPQTTHDSKSSWATWILGGTAVAGAFGYLSYKYWWRQKQLRTIRRGKTQEMVDQQFKDTVKRVYDDRDQQFKDTVKKVYDGCDRQHVLTLKEFQPILDLLKEFPTVNAINSHCPDALILAMLVNDPSMPHIIKQLIDARADVSHSNHCGSTTPLHMFAIAAAFCQTQEQTCSNVVDLLVKNKADLQAKDSHQRTPLSRAKHFLTDRLHRDENDAPIISVLTRARR